MCEYGEADQARWVLVDAQLDERQCQQLGIDFDRLDVPRDQFIVGGQAWQLCRAGQADPEAFGVGERRGLWFVRGDFIRDVAALNKMELLPWDTWGILEQSDYELKTADWVLLDRSATLTAGDVAEIEADPRWRVPHTVPRHSPAGRLRVGMAADLALP